MKPFGSITNVLPFVDSVARQELESLVNQSSNYADFAERLSNYVSSKDSSESMVYLAWHHAYNTHDVQAFDKLIDKFPYSSPTRPWFTWWSMTVKGIWSWDLLKEEVEYAISSTLNPWIQFNLYSLKWDCAYTTSSGNQKEERIIQKMTELIQCNGTLECIRSRIDVINAGRYNRENNYKKALTAYELALQHALSYDDIDYAAKIKISIAHLLARIDQSKALEMIESAGEMIERLGYRKKKYDLWGIRATIFDARGEYDGAVESSMEALELRERIHPFLSPRYIPAALSRYYRRMGQKDEALEWARMALTSEPILSLGHNLGLPILGNLYMAAALALIGRVEEARSYLDIGSELVFNSGSELWLSDMYLCTGLMERAEGKFQCAMLSFEKALEIVERLQRQGRINEYLLRLAETEIQLHFGDTIGSVSAIEFSWNNRLEVMARKKDLPGILGLALLLKARIQLLQDKTDEAQATLFQVSELSKNPSTRFLQAKTELLLSMATLEIKKKNDSNQ